MHFLCLARCQLGFLLRQFELFKLPVEKQNEILRKEIGLVSRQNIHIHAGVSGSQMFRLFCDALGDPDPLRAVRKKQNGQMLRLLPEIRRAVEQKDDPMLYALRAAASGNIIDVSFADEFDVAGALEKSMEEPFAIDDYAPFRERLLSAGTLTLVTDNAGEIVLDRLLLEVLGQWRRARGLPPLTVSVMVKGGPIYNDALEEDARMAGLDREGEILDTGTDCIGLHPRYMSREALENLRKADMIILKGLANYESDFGGEKFPEKVFYLFRSKCEVLSDALGIALGSSVLMAHSREEEKENALHTDQPFKETNQ